MSIIERAAARLDAKKGMEPSPSKVSRSPTLQVIEPNDEPITRPPQLPAGKVIEIDLARLSKLGFITAGGASSLVAEQFRVIKRPLIKRAFNPKSSATNPGNLIMVTSALPGEGKTFCAINLAMSIAMEMDHTVLLVDADIAHPSVLKTLGIEADSGLLDILLEQNLNVADVLLKSNVDTLTILPSGKSKQHATELLASHAMSLLLKEIASRYSDRIVIFDSPPLLLTSSAHALASQMGQIVVVVEAETTSQHAVQASLKQLEGCSNVNLVYNKSRVFPGQESYGYGEYY
ncbi:XrtA-associated tyrosine autokinase [Glaciimonas sp. CA11.2]|uniref:XrtA-associated tyrosine autokinase n=1 Tax=Glaciimonas sp. CA11.2 TaxID=3048601 RepID=UPI002AB3F25B|nr:XrtA-associated tyrosine autokinase [Glaciimonas sp. CA11.2]MDY7544691.1 XrtA-associated tyrosine autokinase [Glaciimonas sp. CA11.2]MEB0164555.1 XrtA-associated tyrosine autokinase [Glaciimonas sp. CA11.2]